MNNWLVYVHLSPSNKVYVGITSRDPNYRWLNGKGYTRCSKFYNAILKYGWNNIQHFIIALNLSKELAMNLETSLIRFHKSMNLSYNLTDGGQGGRLGYHIRLSEEWKKKLSLAHIGNSHTEDTKLKMSKSRKGVHLTKEWVLKRSSKNRKVVIAFINNKAIEYPSVREASKALGIIENNIASVCRGERKTAGGYKFKYK